MRRPIRLLTALGLLTALAGCTDDASPGAATPGGSVTTVAAVGNPSTAPAATPPGETPPSGDGNASAVVSEVDSGALPSRIISLSAVATEMLFAIGAGPQVIAVDGNSNYPADAPMTRLSGFEPNVEAIAAEEPDLVVLSDDIANVVAGLGALGIPVVQTPAAVTLDDTYAQIGQLGAATGHVAEAAAVVGKMQAEIAAIVAGARVSAPAEPLTYYHELDPNYYSATSGTFIGQIYEAFGLVNIADATATADDFGYPQLSAEYIVARDPDLVFLADVKCCQMDVAAVAARPGWGALQAVTDGGVVELDDDIASRWGPRVVEQYRAVAAALAKLPVG